MIQAIRSSVKRRDIYESSQKNLGITVGLPSLDVPTRWSSTFNMVLNAYKARAVLNSMTTKVSDLRGYQVSKRVWERAAEICRFLDSAVSITECQSGSSYATVSITTKALQSLLSKCRTFIESSHPLLEPIAKKMFDKMTKYEALLCSELANLAQILDPRFGNDILSHSTVLRRYVILPSASIDDNTITSQRTENDPKLADGAAFMRTLLDEDSLHDPFEDEITTFLRATGIGDKRADPFEWLRGGEKRYPNIVLVARDFLGIQASSVAGEESFSVPGHMVSAQRARLSDESIRSSMLVWSWNKLFYR